jgi:hypothetical protein
MNIKKFVICSIFFFAIYGLGPLFFSTRPPLVDAQINQTWPPPNNNGIGVRIHSFYEDEKGHEAIVLHHVHTTQECNLINNSPQLRGNQKHKYPYCIVLATQPYVDNKVESIKVALEARITEGLKGISKEDIVAGIIKKMEDRIDTLEEEIKNLKKMGIKTL